MKTQQLITIIALHRSKLDLHANVSFCEFIYIFSQQIFFATNSL